jgi:hypothetical protein
MLRVASEYLSPAAGEVRQLFAYARRIGCLRALPCGDRPALDFQ